MSKRATHSCIATRLMLDYRPVALSAIVQHAGLGATSPNMRPSNQSLSLRQLSGRRLGRLVVAWGLGAIAVVSCAVSPSARAQSTPMLTATTGPATVHGPSEVTLTATINDGGQPAAYRFQVQPDYEWFGETPEEAFARSTTTGYGTPPQAIPSSLEAQQVSAVFAPPPQHSHYAYRVVMEVNGSAEQILGQPLAFEVAIKTLPPPPMESPPSETSPNTTRGPSIGQNDPSPTKCQVPRLTALTLARARHLIATAHCGTLKIVGKRTGRWPRITSQSPHPHSIIARDAQITVWLHSSTHHTSRR